MNQHQSPSLARVIGPVTATAIVIGTIIGSGVFKKPATIAPQVPYFGLVAAVWIVGGLLVILGALAYAEVAVLFPRTGGNYVFLTEAYGRLAGFLWGWVDFWIIRSASIAALATIFAESLGEVISNRAFQRAVGLASGSELGPWSQRSLTVGTLLGLGLVNIRGVRLGGGLQVLLTLIKMASLVAIAVLPFFFLSPESAQPPGGTRPQWENLQPVWPTDWRSVSLAGLGSAMLGVYWAYHGWMNLAPVAGEIRQPQRNLPLALLTGVGIIVALYLSVNLAYYLSASGEEMAELTQPKPNLPEARFGQEMPRTVAALFALRLLGSLGMAAISAAIMCSVFGSLNGNILVGPRLLFAMGQDGLAPRWLCYIHPRWRTPSTSIAVLVLWASLQVLIVAILTDQGILHAGKSAFDRLTDFAMFGALLFETLAVLAVFRFRHRLPHAERPYRCPGYPWVPIIYAAVAAFVLVMTLRQEPAEAQAGLSFIAVGAMVYMIWLDRAGSSVGPQPHEQPAQSGSE